MPEIDAKENLPAGREEKITAKQRWGAGFLIFLSIAILAFGLWQFSYRVKAPFAGRGAGLKNFKSLDEKELEKMLAKQTRDTDSDGLTDFDEEYVYKTSPYLDDSDSDGYSDKQEIDSSNDPNCPSGKNCGLPEVTNTPADGGTAALDSLGENTEEVSAMQALLSGRATAEEIRAALKAQGVGDDVLSKVDDKTLLETYAQALKETDSAGALANINLAPSESYLNVNSFVNSGIGSGSDLLAGVSPAEARQMLLEAGVDKTLLDQVDDATLMQILEEAMKQSSQ